MKSRRRREALQLAHTAIRFGFVGLINTTVGVGAILLSRKLLGLNEYSANAVGFALGLAVGFAGNYLWTFKARQRPMATVWRYLLAFALAYLLNLAALAALLHGLTLPGPAAQLFAIVAYTICFFLLCRFFVFRTTPSSSGSQAQAEMRRS